MDNTADTESEIEHLAACDAQDPPELKGRTRAVMAAIRQLYDLGAVRKSEDEPGTEIVLDRESDSERAFALMNILAETYGAGRDDAARIQAASAEIGRQVFHGGKSA